MKSVFTIESPIIYKIGTKCPHDHCPLGHSVLHLYTIKNVHTSTVFMVAPPPPSTSSPAGGTDSTGRSPASKHPNESSGTCPAGDRPGPKTRSSSGATGSRRGGTPSDP